ncbi:DNA polymerase III subunit gamma/tau, partial [Patescibacteria group bacterium]|nr:DNA polymerase III subunit gamma/tau [Patescibacteria group bacterium]
MPSLSQLYRPRRFADVTGQQHVTDTLRAELATGHLGHAFLFSGPRGVGKTTCARILAKTLGCASPQGGEPCESCPSCQQFLEGRSLDVIEIDAATHTGVDMIREAIIEHVRFAPVGKRKVYILDEAHMLTPNAWNALLKTLEEPPSYAFFVFATTEWHKVPPTILSRCQRFEFRRIQDGDMVTRLRDLAERQSWKVEAEVFPLIASRAEGCLRDAETLLAQVGALAEDGVISFATAGLVIPVSSMDQALRWLELVAGRASQEANEQVLAWQDAGVSFTTLFDDVLELIKGLLQAQANPSLLKGWEQGTAEDRRLALLVKRWTGQELRAQALELMDRRRDLKSGMDPVFVALLAWQMVTAS